MFFLNFEDIYLSQFLMIYHYKIFYNPGNTIRDLSILTITDGKSRSLEIIEKLHFYLVIEKTPMLIKIK